MIACPFHHELGELVEGRHVGSYDDEDFNHIGTVEIDQFVCTVDPTHTWEHPSRNFQLRFMAWGVAWKHVRDRFNGID